MPKQYVDNCGAVVLQSGSGVQRIFRYFKELPWDVVRVKKGASGITNRAGHDTLTMTSRKTKLRRSCPGSCPGSFGGASGVWKAFHRPFREGPLGRRQCAAS